jgi:hypothetical protein
MVWHYSTLTWVLIGLFIAMSPWSLTPLQRAMLVPLACLPILYGVVAPVA